MMRPIAHSFREAVSNFTSAAVFEGLLLLLIHIIAQQAFRGYVFRV